eukprot:754739-Hanusia_phi.AAC.2
MLAVILVYIVSLPCFILCLALKLASSSRCRFGRRGRFYGTDVAEGHQGATVFVDFGIEPNECMLKMDVCTVQVTLIILHSGSCKTAATRDRCVQPPECPHNHYILARVVTPEISDSVTWRHGMDVRFTDSPPLLMRISQLPAVATILVVMMTVPGLALFYGGLAQVRKSRERRGGSDWSDGTGSQRLVYCHAKLLHHVRGQLPVVCDGVFDSVQ